MIKLVLEIEEEKIKDIDDIRAICCNVNFTEMRSEATEGEIKSSEILQQKIGIEDKIQINNNCRLEKNRKIVDLIKELL